MADKFNQQRERYYNYPVRARATQLHVVCFFFQNIFSNSLHFRCNIWHRFVFLVFGAFVSPFAVATWVAWTKSWICELLEKIRFLIFQASFARPLFAQTFDISNMVVKLDLKMMQGEKMKGALIILLLLLSSSICDAHTTKQLSYLLIINVPGISETSLTN